MIVVSDTSPITNLVDIGRLELLCTLFGAVLVPREVFRELAEEGTGTLTSLSEPFLNWASKADRLSFDVPTLPLFS